MPSQDRVSSGISNSVPPISNGAQPKGNKGKKGNKALSLPNQAHATEGVPRQKKSKTDGSKSESPTVIPEQLL
jgi:hypothetical protein